MDVNHRRALARARARAGAKWAEVTATAAAAAGADTGAVAGGIESAYWRTQLPPGYRQMIVNTGAAAGEAAGAMDSGDWRSQLMPDSRQRIVNKIMVTLNRHLPVTSQEGVQELKKIAVRFEEKIYTAATSQNDYLRKISLKMLTMEAKSHNPMTNSPNAASSGQNAHGSVKMQNAKVSRDIRRPAKYMSSSWTGNGRSKRKRRAAEMIKQSCKHRRLGRGDKAVFHAVILHDDCVENDQRKLDDEEPTI